MGRNQWDDVTPEGRELVKSLLRNLPLLPGVHPTTIQLAKETLKTLNKDDACYNEE